ncbi:hypothetical protein A2Z63_00215 [Candidatus Giovannonibacteria bacterium RIFCSPLOWO2_02_44_8]|uniref:Nucleotidyl transferase AbiEii/AbiGii toxin family protein n=3 Tax=Candidatus Giovannoniibacteriota TaxID=1752738 RepID=A0A1F5XDS0_9BACT|nr:MAG: hypothetical protein A2W57_01810 [Candidatus Giovannonibacteria bacterium RIFCSPHIGHO2_02_43_16]OGF86010.1 MAG: hypothetical protein A2Z63_00215 [Candidatus Giovannonibacteria bacterium RIFCSPLOWO2_02_44_8]OGF95711.1 MAG: hypothetical protein A2Y47_01215 [Candidatus Giovannonibacteria bacterium RIFCSPLOWO2_12_43_8]
MGEEVLTQKQKDAITHISSTPELASFYLSGGTALAAYYLRHRLSDDLDFFSPEKPDLVFLHAFSEKLKNILEAKEILYTRLYDRNQFFFSLKRGEAQEELKIEFTYYPFPNLEGHKIIDGVKIASIRDIAAGKLMALLDRFDPKDFVDLYFLMKGTQLKLIWKDAENKFGIKIDPIFLGGELAKVKRVEGLPKMIKRLTVEELKTFFSEKAQELKSDIF